MPTRLPPRLEEVHCPLPWQEWDCSLASHPDQQFCAYIRDGLCYGFQVGYDYRHSCQKARRNMASALEQPQVIREYLGKECSEGQILPCSFNHASVMMLIFHPGTISLSCLGSACSKGAEQLGRYHLP